VTAQQCTKFIVDLGTVVVYGDVVTVVYYGMQFEVRENNDKTHLLSSEVNKWTM